jgi:hypothetical protein
MHGRVSRVKKQLRFRDKVHVPIALLLMVFFWYYDGSFSYDSEMGRGCLLDDRAIFYCDTNLLQVLVGLAILGSMDDLPSASTRRDVADFCEIAGRCRTDRHPVCTSVRIC